MRDAVLPSARPAVACSLDRHRPAYVTRGHAWDPQQVVHGRNGRPPLPAAAGKGNRPYANDVRRISWCLIAETGGGRHLFMGVSRKK